MDNKFNKKLDDANSLVCLLELLCTNLAEKSPPAKLVPWEGIKLSLTSIRRLIEDYRSDLLSNNNGSVSLLNDYSDSAFSDGLDFALPESLQGRVRKLPALSKVRDLPSISSEFKDSSETGGQLNTPTKAIISQQASTLPKQ